MLVPTLLVVAVQLATAAPGPVRARVPADVPMSGLLELTRQGEIALLPVHDVQPFNAVVVTRSKEP